MLTIVSAQWKKPKHILRIIVVVFKKYKINNLCTHFECAEEKCVTRNFSLQLPILSLTQTCKKPLSLPMIFKNKTLQSKTFLLMVF